MRGSCRVFIAFKLESLSIEDLCEEIKNQDEESQIQKHDGVELFP
jgi:hypothetical protein